MTGTRRKILRSAAGLSLAACAAPALTQTPKFPTRPIRIIFPFAPGGGGDIIARFIAARLTESIGQSVIVENRPGASGITGLTVGLATPPDGYTIMLISNSYTVNPSIFKLTYNSITDITPIVRISQGPLIIACHPDFPATTTAELIAYGRANPAKINFASAGMGTITGLAGELFAATAEFKLTHVPYKSTGLAVNDTMAGVTDIVFSASATAVPQVKNGRLRAIAVTGAKRSPALPDVPTVMESGLSGFEVSLWHGLIGPKGMPKEIVDRLNAEVNGVLKHPETPERLQSDGVEPAGGTAGQFDEVIRQEIETWGKVARMVGLKPE